MRNNRYILFYTHEVSRLTRSLRFRVSLPLLLLLFVCASRLFVSYYTEHASMSEQLEEDQWQKDERLSDNLTAFVNENRIFRYSPRTDGFLYGCKEGEMVNSFQYNVWAVNDLLVEQGISNPFLEARSLVDWTFMVSMFFSFIALLFSFDSVCGEKRDQVLAYLFSYPISRKAYWMGKITSHVSVVMGLLSGGVLVGLLALSDILGMVYSPALLGEVLGFIGISFLFVTLFTCFGLFASVLIRHSNVSLLICASFWLFSAIILPNSATYLGNTLYPVPLVQDVLRKMEEEKNRLRDEAPPGSMAREGGNPFYLYHERRAALFMRQKEVTSRLSEQYYRLLIRQFEGTRRLMLLSPVIQYERAMESLLGGGYLRFQRNRVGLDQFRGAYEAWFKEKDARDPDSPHWYNPYEDTSTSTKPVDLKDVPCYREQPVPVVERLRYLGIYVAVSLLLIGLLVWGGIRLLGSYDVR